MMFNHPMISPCASARERDGERYDENPRFETPQK